MKILLDNIRFILRSWCGRSPFLIQLIGKVRGFYSNVCNEKTDVVIEAFPRSANTYCVAVFRTLSNDRLSIASHMHSAAQFKLANRFNKPALLIVRDPLDAISSLSIRRPLVKKRHLIKEYVCFHKTIIPLISEGKVIVLRFDDAICRKSLLQDVARRMLGEHAELLSVSQDAFGNKVTEMIENMEKEDAGGIVRETHVARPSSVRNKMKEQVISELLKETLLIDKAKSVYMEIIENVDAGL